VIPLNQQIKGIAKTQRLTKIKADWVYFSEKAKDFEFHF